MPKGIYKRTPEMKTGKYIRTEEHKRRNGMKEKHYTEEEKEGLRKKLKGKHTSFKTEFQKGHIPWCKGKRRLEMSGERNWKWKGGITPLDLQIRHSFQYRQWRSDVFTRDNFTCQECGARNGNGKAVYLEADHYPKGFADIMNEYKIKTFQQALDCEKLWDINNGRTLCSRCHNKIKKR